MIRQAKNTNYTKLNIYKHYYTYHINTYNIITIPIMTSQAVDIENNPFIYQPMLTCIGNKRKLVTNIHDIISQIKQTLGKSKLNIVDAFAGSSVVSRMLTFHADTLHTNDMELYSYIMAQCYLVTPSPDQQPAIQNHINNMNRIAMNGPYTPGIICSHYAPAVTTDIKDGERCFYTRENALIIDTLRTYIDTVESELKVYCLAPLLVKASIHTNTAGVFKGFYKKDNIGCFGGSGENALSRIMKPIVLEMPIWNIDDTYTSLCYNGDINNIIKTIPANIDIIYLDPPYNQHPYGSNYFMLNVIATNTPPIEPSKVSGIGLPANSISAPRIFFAPLSIAFPVDWRFFPCSNNISFVPCTLSSTINTGITLSANCANIIPPSGFIYTFRFSGFGGGPPALWKYC